MAIATDQQVQRFADDRVRARCRQIRSLYLACKSDKQAFDDIYAALTQQNPTWTDSNTFSPPHLLTGNDVLAWNTFITGIIALMEHGLSSDMTAAQDQVSKVLAACIDAAS